MNLVIAVLGFCALLGCFVTATHMTSSTRHSIRLAVIVMGLGAILAVAVPANPHLMPYAFAVFMVGVSAFRIFDRRLADYHAGADPVAARSPGGSPAFAVNRAAMVGEAGLSLLRVEHSARDGERRFLMH